MKAKLDQSMSILKNNGSVYIDDCAIGEKVRNIVERAVFSSLVEEAFSNIVILGGIPCIEVRLCLGEGGGGPSIVINFAKMLRRYEEDNGPEECLLAMRRAIDRSLSRTKKRASSSRS
jgi:hypothetical protein